MQQVVRTLSALVLVLGVTLVAGCGGSGVPTDSSQTASVVQPASLQSEATTAPLASPAVSAASSDQQPMIIGFKHTPDRNDDDHLSCASAHVKHRFGLIPAMAADLSPTAVSALRADPNVDFVEPDAIVHASVDQLQWGVAAIGANKVWATKDFGASVKIGVIDTGIDYNHPDLAARYKGGYNFIFKNNNPHDDNGHGTHVCGIIAAAANGSGVEGIAPNAGLYALKVLGADGSGTYSNVIAALDWCVTHKMQIASMSLGAPANSTALHNACDAAYKAGVLLVAAAGNSGGPGITNSVEYPGAFSSVVAVAAVGQGNVHPSWSSTGPAVEISAPGVNILSDHLGGGLVMMSGTSMACPQVTGVAALLIAHGTTGAAAIRSRLDATATDLGTAGRDSTFGYGLVNAAAACGLTTVASL